MAYLALLDQILDRAGHVFYRHLRIDAMVIQVDVIGLLERFRLSSGGA
jgi:hypothetical protein